MVDPKRCSSFTIFFFKSQSNLAKQNQTLEFGFCHRTKVQKIIKTHHLPTKSTYTSMSLCITCVILYPVICVIVLQKMIPFCYLIFGSIVEQKLGVQLLHITKKDHTCLAGLPGCFGPWLQHLRTNVKPPLKMAISEKIIILVKQDCIVPGLAFRHKSENKVLDVYWTKTRR